MSASAVYRTSPVKRDRRTKAEVADLRSTLKCVIQRYQPMTVRQVFYQLVSMGAISKTEQEY